MLPQTRAREEPVDDYEAYDAMGLAELVRSGETTPTALLDAAIERLEKRNPTLNAVVIPMLEHARHAVAAGLPDGPFRGVPFLLKDLHVSVPGVRTTYGSRLFAENVPTTESELAARYRRAGLVTFGKTHSPEFGLATSSESRLFGQTKNPWDRTRGAGGSSGGAAAAVAAGLVPAAHATDGGGSIRVPASCCGLFGLKPTRGRTPAGPDAGEGWSGMSAQHAVSRSVRDSAALLDATHGPDLGAPYAAQPPPGPFLAALGAKPKRLRIALPTETWNGAPTHPTCVTAARDAAKLCASLGHEVEEARFEVELEPFREATGTIIGANTRATMEDRARALGRTLSPEDVEPGTWLVASGGAARDAVAYVRAVRTIHRLGRALARFLERYDVLLTPTMAVPPVPLGVLSLSNPNPGESLATLFQTVGYTQLANATGNPAMSVPLFWDGEGLPIGSQFVGRMDDEATLFRLAAQLEQARPWFDRRPPLDV
jgi:Asp-tRNA(Asn)/Glu-tRNA(Gln) amidotransferase A subunit family amidase